MESALPARLDPQSLLGPNLWRATEQACIRTRPTGFASLDRILPGGGWPVGAVSEILPARIGVGEMSLALPLLAKLSQEESPVALIDPPHIPHAPRLASAGLKLSSVHIIESGPHPRDAFWSAELLLRAGGSVLLWANQPVDAQALRRLQLAAEEGESFALLIRLAVHATESTPSALRLRIWRQAGRPQVELLKCRGARPAAVDVSATPSFTSQSNHSLPGEAA